MRRLILRQLYEVSDPVSGFHVRPGDVIGALSDHVGTATGPDCDNAIGYLEADGLVERPSHDQLRITHLGVRAVEEEDDPEPVAGVGLTITGAERAEVEGVITQLSRALETGGVELEGEERADLEAQLDTVEAQLRSPRPKRSVIRHALLAASWIGATAFGGVVQGGAWDGLEQLVERLA